MALVLHLDENNGNSWGGEPTTNIIPLSTQQDPPLAIYGGACTQETDLYDIFTGYNTMNRFTVTDADSGIRVRYLYNNENYTMTSGISYTFSFWVRVTNKTSANLKTQVSMLQSPYTARDSEIHTANDDWTFISHTYTSSYTEKVRWVVKFDQTEGIFEICAPQIEVKSYPTKWVNGSRSSFYDISGNDNHGDVSNMSFSETQQGLVYDGSSKISGSASNLNFGASDFTFSCWAKTTSPTDVDRKIFHFNLSSSNGVFQFRQENSSLLYVQTYNGGWNTVSISEGFYDTEWRHIVFTKIGSNIRFFINGEEKSVSGNVHSTLSTSSTNIYYIGSRLELEKWIGYIPIIKIWNTALSQSEIQDEYNRYRTRYGKPPLAGTYMVGGLPGPLLYNFDCLTDISLRGEETENVLNYYESWNAWPSNSSNMYTLTTRTSAHSFTVIGTCNVPGSMVFIYPYISLPSELYTLSATFTNNSSETSAVYLYIRGYGNDTSTVNQSSGWTLQPGDTVRKNLIGNTLTVNDGYTVAIGVYSNPTSGQVNMNVTDVQLEKKSFATPFTPNYRYNWEAVRNLANRQYFGYFMNDGYTTYPQIDTSDYNGLKCESSSSTVGNFVVLQKPNIVKDGLVLHLDAGNKESYPGSGTTWYDLISSNNGNLNGGVSYNTNNLGILEFNGSTGYIEINNNSFISNTEATILAWIKLSAGGVFQTIFMSGVSGATSSNTSDKLFLGINTSNQITCGWITGGEPDLVSVSSVLSLNTWYHVGVRYSTSPSGVARILNTDITTGDVMTGNSTNTHLDLLRIGTNMAASEILNGNVGIVKVYSKALSADEVKQNFLSERGRYGV